MEIQPGKRPPQCSELPKSPRKFYRKILTWEKWIHKYTGVTVAAAPMVLSILEWHPRAYAAAELTPVPAQIREAPVLFLRSPGPTAVWAQALSPSNECHSCHLTPFPPGSSPHMRCPAHLLFHVCLQGSCECCTEARPLLQPHEVGLRSEQLCNIKRLLPD